MRVELQQQAAAMNGPRCIRIAAMGGGRLVLRVRLIRLLGFRGAFLKQKDRKQNVSRHLEELALPVLEHGRDEMAASEIGQKVDGGSVVKTEVLDMGPPSGQRLTGKR